MFHIFRDSLQEAQRLVEGNGHRDLGQFLFNIKIKAEYTLLYHKNCNYCVTAAKALNTS